LGVYHVGVFAILSWLVQNFYTPSGGITVCVRESPLTRVELRRHCSRGNAISRFLATVVSSVVITLHPKWKTFLARPTLHCREIFASLNVTRVEYFNVLQCLQAINVPSIFAGICKNCWLSIIIVN